MNRIAVVDQCLGNGISVPLEAPLIFDLGVTVQLKTVPLTDELKLILVDAFEQID